MTTATQWTSPRKMTRTKKNRNARHVVHEAAAAVADVEVVVPHL